MKNKAIYFVFPLLCIAAVACTDDPTPPPMAEISIADSQLTMPYGGETQDVTINVNRSWRVESNVSWLAFDPSSAELEAGETVPQTISITALPNEYGDSRSAEVTIRTLSRYVKLSIVQSENPDGAPLIIYHNDFDRALVSEGSGWPLLSGSSDWMNQTGSGIGTLSYYFSGNTSVRSNSPSTSHSDYADQASGNNGLFFGTNSASFTVGNLSLHPDHRNIEVTFGSEKYLYGGTDAQNTFNPEEFPVMVSADGQNWVTAENCRFLNRPAGDYPIGTWDLAIVQFTLPGETANLWIRFAPTVASAYRLDDLTIQMLMEDTDNVIDWSQATAIDPGTEITVTE